MPYSYATYTGNGSQTQFDLTFPYIRKEHVKVYVNYVDTAFTWVNDARVQLATAPANGVQIQVRRLTPISAPLVDYTDGSTLVAADLDTNALQQTYVNQEQDDSLKDTVSVNAQGLPDAGGKRIVNVGTPTAAQDAATKTYVDGLIAAATIADADYGDITVSGNAMAWTIDNGVVTSAKIADGTIVDGDISASAEIAVGKLANGTARQLLQTDAAGTGVEWTNNPIVSSLNDGPLAGMRNRIINGDMRIKQTPDTATVNDGVTSFYSPDRWRGTGEASDGVFTLTNSTTTVPTGFTHALRASISTADASIGASQRYIISQRIEGRNVSDLAWGTANARPVTLSFWVLCSLTGTFGGVVRNGFDNRSYPFSYAINTANTWEYKTVVIAGDTGGNWDTGANIGMDLAFSLGAGSSVKGTAGTWSGSSLWSATGAVDPISTSGATFRITGVQLEAGTVATPFERRSYGLELALCQRYYTSTRAVNGAGLGMITGVAVTTSRIIVPYSVFPVVMRATPTMTVYSAAAETSGALVLYNSTLTPVGSGFTLSANSSYGFSNSCNGSASLTVGSYYSFSYEASAEL